MASAQLSATVQAAELAPYRIKRGRAILPKRDDAGKVLRKELFDAEGNHSGWGPIIDDEYHFGAIVHMDPDQVKRLDPDGDKFERLIPGRTAPPLSVADRIEGESDEQFRSRMERQMAEIQAAMGGKPAVASSPSVTVPATIVPAGPINVPTASPAAKPPVAVGNWAGVGAMSLRQMQEFAEEQEIDLGNAKTAEEVRRLLQSKKPR